MFTLKESAASPGFESIWEDIATAFDSSEIGRWNPFAYVYRKSI